MGLQFDFQQRKKKKESGCLGFEKPQMKWNVGPNSATCTICRAHTVPLVLSVGPIIKLRRMGCHFHFLFLFFFFLNKYYIKLRLGGDHQCYVFIISLKNYVFPISKRCSQKLPNFQDPFQLKKRHIYYSMYVNNFRT